MKNEPLPPLIEPSYSDRPAFVALLGCGLGVFAFSTQNVLFWSLILLLAGILLFITSSHIHPFRCKGIHYALSPILRTGALICLVGAMYGPYAAERTRETLTFPESLSLHNHKVIILYPVKTSASSPVKYASLVTMGGKEYRILLSLADGRRLSEEYGSQVFADLKLGTLATGRSYHRYLLSEGYDAHGCITPLSDPFPLTRTPLISRLRHWREKMFRSFSLYSSQWLTPSSQGLVAALSLGDRSRLSVSEKEDFTSAGVAHVMAVSGYHLGVVFFLVSWLAKSIFWSHRHRHLRYALLLIVLLLYTLLSGASTPTLRAFVMSALGITAVWLGRRADSIQFLSLTLLFFLILEPFSYLSTGLMLSVGAVWGIFAFLPIWQRLIRPSLRVLVFFRDAFFVTVSAQVALIPLLSFYFGKVSLSILWSNIPIVFLSGILIPYGLISIFLSPLLGPAIPWILYAPIGVLSETTTGMTRYFGRGELFPTITGEWSFLMVIVYYLLLVVVQKFSIRLVNRLSDYPA